MRYFNITAEGAVTETSKDSVGDADPEAIDNLFSTSENVSTVQVSFADGTHLRVERDDSGTPMQTEAAAQ